MARHCRLLSVAFLVVMLAATPALPSDNSSFASRGGHGLHRGFHRHHAHLGRHFSFGVPRHHRFGRHFSFQRKPQLSHPPFKQHDFSPHTRRR
jgi:hypothetical protein